MVVVVVVVVERQAGEGRLRRACNSQRLSTPYGAGRAVCSIRALSIRAHAAPFATTTHRTACCT